MHDIMKLGRKENFTMKKFTYMTTLALAASMFALGGCSSNSSSSPTTPTIAYNEASTSHYDVVKRDKSINVDGKLDDEAWKDIPAIAGGFHFPWDKKEAPYTEFKGYHDKDNFYFCFTVKDSEVLQDDNWKDDESTVDMEDRVELFFAGPYIDKPGPDGTEKYYGLEIDPKGRVHDYSIEYYRKFDGKWNMEGLETKATVTDDGYIVEGKIPMKSLQDLKLINHNVMRAGIYRAEFSKPEASGKDPKMEWISWVDPKTANPDFHVASSFGEFRFLQ